MRQTPLWISHHWPEDYDRCVHVGRTHLCRRCLVMYPTIVVAAAVIAFTAPSIGPALIASMWLLPAPMVAEWVLEHSRLIRYSAVRQMIFSALAGLGFGASLGLHLNQPFMLVAVAPVATAVTICTVSGLVGARRRDPDQADTWSDEHEAAELERQRQLIALLGEDPSGWSATSSATDRSGASTTPDQ